MNKNHIKLQKDIILFRGTTDVNPLMNGFCYKLKNCQYISTNLSKKIAKEFTGKNGYLHILYCKKGIKIYDNDVTIKREKEILILPNHQLTLLEFKNNVVKWKVESI